MGRPTRTIGLGGLVTVIKWIRSYGGYLIGEDAQNADFRRARIRADMKSLLLMIEPDIPAGALIIRRSRRRSTPEWLIWMPVRHAHLAVLKRRVGD